MRTYYVSTELGFLVVATERGQPPKFSADIRYASIWTDYDAAIAWAKSSVPKRFHYTILTDAERDQNA